MTEEFESVYVIAGKQLMQLSDKVVNYPWLIQDKHFGCVQIHLLYPRTLQGVLMQGARASGAMVTSFTLQYGTNEAFMLWYEEYPKHPKVTILSSEIFDIITIHWYCC